MKKIDKLILTSFIGPFVLTFLVVVFILLLQHMLKYFDDIIGKDLGWDVVGSLLFYFAIFMTPLALPLAVLLSSLITFGNLSEHFEITAVKSLGISLVRSLVPIFFFVLFLTGIAFYANNNWVPKAALEAYSLMYDIKQKKPALDLEEGAFYNGIPDMSIKVGHKFPDGKTIKDVIIYDHRGRSGNKEVTIADSGRMFTILNDQYLKLELYNGTDYLEGQGDQNVGVGSTQETLRRTQFGKTELVFDLSSFGLSRTDKKWFQGNRIMRNVIELDHDMDSVNNEIKQYQLSAYNAKDMMFSYHDRQDTLKLPAELVAFRLTRDTSERIKKMGPYVIFTNQGLPLIQTKQLSAKVIRASDSLFKPPAALDEVSRALVQTRMLKSQMQNLNSNRAAYWNEYKIFRAQWHKILANSIACIVMFLIGAPLGAIIKKGGLGVPVIVSILFFIMFYLIMSTGEKWAGQDKISVPVGIWAADFILALVGLLFLRQARVDARLFDADFYRVVLERAQNWWEKRKIKRLSSN